MKITLGQTTKTSESTKRSRIENDEILFLQTKSTLNTKFTKEYFNTFLHFLLITNSTDWPAQAEPSAAHLDRYLPQQVGFTLAGKLGRDKTFTSIMHY